MGQNEYVPMIHTSCMGLVMRQPNGVNTRPIAKWEEVFVLYHLENGKTACMTNDGQLHWCCNFKPIDNRMNQMDKISLMAAYSHYNGKWPSELDASGVMFWNGLRITKADFRAMKRDGIQSERFK